MINLLLVAAAVSAVLAIVADSQTQRHSSFYLLKPLTTLVLVAYALLKPAASESYQDWVVAALLLSTLGDICLMFPGKVWFGAGLSSFLIAHLLFIVAFVEGVDPVRPPLWAYGILVGALPLLVMLLPRAGVLAVPVLIYCSVILAMFLAAAARDATLGDTAARYALVGAGIFVVSDSALSIREFRRPYPGAQALILSTYWLAIGLIAYSI